MSWIDKPDFKTGFWIGLGVFLAAALLSLLMSAYYKARSRARG
jgi:hypothetical protein